MTGIQKDRFTRDSAAVFLPKLPESADSAIAGTMLCAVTQVKPARFNDSLLLGHNSLVTAHSKPASLTVLPWHVHSPVLKVVLVLLFSDSLLDLVLVSKRRLTWRGGKSKCET